MKDEVVVNGIKLTRTQVENAIAELNQPEWVPTPGSYKVPNYERVVVFNSWSADNVRNGGVPDCKGYVTCVNAGTGEIIRLKLENFNPSRKYC